MRFLPPAVCGGIDFVARIVQLVSMLRFLKVLAVMLAIGALVAPGASVPACADSHDADCCMDCSCVCHCAVSFPDCRESTGNVAVSVARRVVDFESCCMGILLAADIFRPPALA